MGKKSFYQKLYKYDDNKKKYLIEVSLDDYNDVYDDWDPSPFKKRDIEQEFNDFIVNSSEDIPLNHNIGILLYLPQDKKNEKKEVTLVLAYENYYNYIIEKMQKSISSLNSKIIFNFLFSIFLLFLGYFYSSESESIILKIFQEGIFVGGWVFLWDFFTDIFYTKRTMKNNLKLYKRLLNAEIKFIYK